MLKPFSSLICISLLFLATGASLVAQEPPVIVSPEVFADRSVVLRLWAPRANVVELAGDWLGTSPMVPMRKDNMGVWSVTVGPLEPNIYSYAFYVDDTRGVDPACRCTYAWGAGRGASTRFTVPGQTPAPWENQNRPPGALHYERFYSKVQKRMRRTVVYTPPDYESSKTRKYPVMVLLPGTPGDETEWTSGGGYVDILFDNLIAEGRMTPMIVVMHASDVDEKTEFRRGDDNLHQFENILVNELVPMVKQRYRVNTSADSWAVVGLSLGGEFGLYAGLNHPELFRTIASMSGSLVPPGFDGRFGPALSKPGLGKNYRLLWIGCGADDSFLDGAKAFVERLEMANVKPVFRQFPGTHAMPVFRLELMDLLPRLFR